MNVISEQKMKNLIRAKHKETGLNIQQLYNLFGAEQLIKKIAESKYKDYFVLKGGYLLATQMGLENRMTKDIDSTIKDFPLNDEEVEKFIDYIVSPEEKGKQYFSLKKRRDIRKDFLYPGYNLKFNFHNGNSKFEIDLDLTTGENLLEIDTNKETKLLFEEKSICMPSYPMEQVLCDKYYTMLAYETDGTRMKDYYDMLIIPKLENINYQKTHQMLKRTLEQRESNAKFYYGFETIKNIENSDFQKEKWNDWKKEKPYAKNIPFETVVDAMRNIYNHLKEANNYFRENEPEKLMPYTPADKLMQQTLIEKFAVNEDENKHDLNDYIDLDI